MNFLPSCSFVVAFFKSVSFFRFFLQKRLIYSLAVLTAMTGASQVKAQVQIGDFCVLKSDVKANSGKASLVFSQGEAIEIVQVLKSSIQVKSDGKKAFIDKKRLEKTCEVHWARCDVKKSFKIYPRRKKRKEVLKKNGFLVVEVRELIWSRVQNGKQLFFAKTRDIVKNCKLGQGPLPRAYNPHWPRLNRQRDENIVVLPFAARGVSDSEVKLVERTFSKAFIKSRKDSVGIPRRGLAETQRSASLKRIIEQVKIDENANANYAVVGMVKKGKGRTWSVTIALIDVVNGKVLKAAKSRAQRNSSEWATKVASLIASTLPAARKIPAFVKKRSVKSQGREDGKKEEALIAKEKSNAESMTVAQRATDAPKPVNTRIPATVQAYSRKKGNDRGERLAERPHPKPTERGAQASNGNLTRDASGTEKTNVSVAGNDNYMKKCERPFYRNTLAGASLGMSLGLLGAGAALGVLSTLDMLAINGMKQPNPAREPAVAAMQQKAAVADVLFISAAASAAAATVFLVLGVDVDGVAPE